MLLRIPALLLLLAALPARAGPVDERPLSVLAVVPLGDPDPRLVQFVADSLRRRFRFEVRVERPIPMPPRAWYAPRKRWRAEKLLLALDAQAPGADLVAGVTEQPLSTTKGAIHDWGIAGLGSLGGRSSVFTAHLFRRFKSKHPALYRRYVENLVLHEVGHTLGRDHCPLERCILADAKGNAVRAARASINEFCPRDTRALASWLRDATPKGSWSPGEMDLLEGRARFAPLP